MSSTISGKCLVLGDNIDTDAIVPGRFLREKNLENFALAGLGAEMPQKLRNFQIIVAGKNFGCGSSREQAAVALKRAGIKCIIAESFARIFYRNTINLGIAVLECKIGAKENEEFEIDLQSGKIQNKSTGATARAAPLSKFALEVLEADGLIPYYKARM
ncbi:MAG: 3-isopropylmalate dehydratase [Candidatus Thermoplasmatota archaeon]|nr:3-isopropylmalate dehydratase [Candidatus Thermoplasmatota archaeon]